MGLTDDLFLLPFDHRSSFEKELFGISGRSPTVQESAEITRYKRIIYDGFIQAVSSGISKKNAGILVDEQFGSEILRDSKTHGYLTACCVEKSGQEDFDFEYGTGFKEHIFQVQPDFVKVLVRYNPDGNAQTNELQAKRLKTLSQFCHKNDLRFLFELLVPATPAQLAQLDGDPYRYDRELRPTLMVKTLKELQTCGVEPDIWKVEGLHTTADYAKIVEQARINGRNDVALIVLGRGEDKETIKKWLSLAAQVPGFHGFAIGRTVWENPLKKVKQGRISASDASKIIAAEYRFFCNLWITAKAPKESRAA